MYNLFYYFKNKDNLSLKFITCFQLVTFLIFLTGIVWRITEKYELLGFFPFRLFPVLTLLFFFFFITQAIFDRGRQEPVNTFLVLGAITLLYFPNIVSLATAKARTIVMQYRTTEDDLIHTLRWVAAHTPHNAVGIVPPWRQSSWYFSQRAQVVNYRMPLYERLHEWRERCDALIGPIVKGDSQEMFHQRYESLTEEAIRALADRYGGDFLVTRSGYNFPLLFQSLEYRVYSIP
jgi:hypothetical protein